MKTNPQHGEKQGLVRHVDVHLHGGRKLATSGLKVGRVARLRVVEFVTALAVLVLVAVAAFPSGASRVCGPP